jgi:hypothetical protein
MVENIIYQSEKYDPEKHCGLNGHFVPVFDSTDHLHFSCRKCREIAIMLRVWRGDSYANTPTIYFLMQCPKCTHVGWRKIYLEDEGKHFLTFPVVAKLMAKTSEDTKSGIVKHP